MPAERAPRSAPPPAPPPAPAETLRLFVALWPGPRTRAALAAWRDGWAWPPGARPVADAKLHVTLHFVGAVARTRLADVIAAVDVPPARFELVFGRAAVWHGGLAVLAPLAVPPALQALHARLGEALARAGLPVEARPYRPHVTLARHASGAQPNPAPPLLRWPVRGHALVWSRPDGRYALLRRFAA